MASAIGWRQSVGFKRLASVGERTRYQPVLNDGRALYRVRAPGQWFYRPLWRLRFEIVTVPGPGAVDVKGPILFRSRARAISIARRWDEAHGELDGWSVDPEDETDRIEI